MNHLDFKLLRSFAAVASERSITRAAERLNLTQPTVSGQLKELEQILGFVLFHRNSRHVSLSDQGERLLPLVETLLQQAEVVRQEAEAMQRATVTRFRLGAAMYTMDFAERVALLDAFSAARPEMHYTIDNRLQSDQVRDLLRERLDAALLLGIATGMTPGQYMVDVPSGAIVNEVQYPDILERVVLSRREIGLLVPEDSDLAALKSIPPDALAGRRVAMLSSEHGEALVNPLANFLLGNGAVPLVPSEGNALAIERYALRHGTCAIGIGWFPPSPGLVHRPIAGMHMAMEYALVLGVSANKAARRFFEFTKRWQGARERTPTAAAMESAAPTPAAAALH